MAVAPYGALLEAVRGVRWPARRPVTSGTLGTHRARTRGIASEFAEYRPYRQGDDPRRIDWKLLGRSDRAFTRLAPNHSVMSTLIVVDASASMAYPVVRASRDKAATVPSPPESPTPGVRVEYGKWTAAKRVAVACAAIAHGGGDPVGLAIAESTGITMLPPRTRRGIVAEVARTLDHVTPEGATELGAAFLNAVPRVLLVTDCLGDIDALRRAARAHVAAGGEVFVAHIVARDEIDAPAGAILATDPEDPAVRRALTDDSRAAYVAAFAAWRAALAGAWRREGIAYCEVRDDDAADVVVRRVVAPPAIGRA